MNRILLLQNGLSNKAGHFFHETQGWKQSLERRGIPHLIFTHRDCPANRLSALGAFPLFRTTPFHITQVHGYSSSAVSLIDAATYFAQDLRRLTDYGLSASDHLLIPFASEKELIGAALFAEQLRSNQLPRVTLVCHRISQDIQLTRTPEGALQSSALIYEYAGLKLAGSLGGSNRLAVVSTNDGLAGVMTQLLRIRCVPGCVTMYYPEAPRAGGPVDYLYDLAFLGTGRAEKRPFLAAAALLEYARRHPNRRSLFHLSLYQRLEQLPERDRAIVAAVQAAPNIEVAAGDIPGERYHEILQRTRVLLMPYEVSAYQCMISGPFSEGAASGKVMLVPEKTWMADMIQKGMAVGRVFSRDEPAAVAAAAEATLKDFDALHQQAQAGAATWRANQSGDRLLDLILRAHGTNGP